MSRPRHAIVCGVRAEGATVREARRLATERVTQFVRESADGPIIRALPAGIVVLAWRDTESWCYALIDPADGLDESAPCRHSGHATAREAEDAARRHAAQWACDRLPERGGECLRADDAEGRRFHARWLAWQNSYAAAKAAGLDDAQARTDANRRAG